MAGNPYLAKNPIDPSRARRRASLGALVQNMNLRSPHAGSPRQVGRMAQNDAEMYNAGAMPWQIEMQRLEMDKQQNQAQRDYWGKSSQTKEFNDYTALFRTGNPPKNAQGKIMSFPEYMRSAGTGDSSHVGDIKQMIRYENARREGEGLAPMTRAEEGEYALKNWYSNKRGFSTETINNAPVVLEQTPEGVVGSVAQNTVGGGGAVAPTGAPQTQVMQPAQQPQMIEQQQPGELPVTEMVVPPSSGIVENTTVTLDEASRGEAAADARAEAMKAEATFQQDLDNAFRQEASDVVQRLRQNLGEVDVLLEAIESGQFNETGPFKQMYKKWSDKETAYLAGAGIYATLQNLQITKLTPVTEEEIKMVERLFASIGNQPEANVGALRQARDRIQGLLNEYQKKGQHWMENGGTLKGYGIKGISGIENWSSPIRPPMADTVVEFGAPPGSQQKPSQGAAHYLQKQAGGN